MSDLGFPKGDVLVPRCGRYLNVQLFALQNFTLFHLHSFLRMNILLTFNPDDDILVENVWFLLIVYTPPPFYLF